MIIEKPSRTYAWFHDVTTLDIEVNRGEGVGAHKVLAGSPIDENGNVANGETAIGLLMETVSDANPDGKIIVAGDVDALGAKNASGIELSDAAKNALSGITWREPDYVVEMPAGGKEIENAKETGGFGWTEQGEQTTIEWDGDTTGKVVVDGGGAGAWCLVSDKTPSAQDVIGGTFYVSGVGDIEITAESVMEMDNIYSLESGTVMVAFEPATVGGLNFPYAGVYFTTEVGNKTSSLTYGTPDTVHGIDPKYLGFVVVNITTDPEIAIDKTYDELQNADKVLPIVDNKIAQFYATGGLVQFVSLTDTYDGFTYLIVSLTEDGEATKRDVFIPFEEA